MKIYNGTSYNYKAIVNGKEYDFDIKTALDVENNSSLNVDLICMNKNSVHLNWLDVILGVFFGDSTVTAIHCDYSFQINDNQETTITIKNNNWHSKEQLFLNSCYADVCVNDEKYILPDISKIRRKHTNLHLFVSSLLPIGILLIILMFIISPPGLPILLFFIWIFVFGIPSIKEVKKFKRAVSQENINQILTDSANEHRQGTVYPDYPASKSGKLVEKILNKMFKFNEE